MPRKLRSTGCRVCVQRHVRCDEARPFCKRCIKSGLQCSGFPPPIQWIDETTDTAETAQKQLQVWQQTPMGSPRHKQDHNIVLTRELKIPSDSLFFHFLQSQFVATDHVHDLDGNHSWLTVILKREEQHPTSMLATRSLAQAYFGRRHGQQAIINDGSRNYGKALLALCDDLKDAKKSKSYDTLTATVALTLFEHFMFTTKQGWVQHSKGVARLMELRGPESFLKYPDRAILDMNRQVLILEALASRRRTFLEQKRWIAVAWPESTPRPPIVRLHDIFAKLPGMTEDILKMADDPTIDSGFVLTTQREMDQILNDLRMLELEMLVDESRTTEEERTSPASPGKPFDTDIRYQSLLAANTWTTFDAVMILTLEWQYKSRHLDWQKGENHEGYELIPEAREYALRICQSIEYLLQPRWMHSGSFYLLFPTRIAFYALPIASPQALWLVGVLERIAMSSGFEMARNVLTNVQINEKRPQYSRSRESSSPRVLPASSAVS